MSKSLSEEFKDQKINDLLEDYIHLENEIKSIPEKLRDSLHAVRTAVDSLPSNLEVGIEKLATAVEEAENSFDELAVKHRSILNNQLDEAKLEIRSAIKNEITGGVSEAIRDANQQLKLDSHDDLVHRPDYFPGLQRRRLPHSIKCITLYIDTFFRTGDSRFL